LSPIWQETGGLPAAAAGICCWRAWAWGTICPLHRAVCLGLGEAVRGEAGGALIKAPIRLQE